ncbi:unnamed protein product [Spirodela intermedia]|uniref:Uncharacterized protein n=1 Tax=Spirodela intermedia TaxID=51605 RepID=A0A7I8KPQ7_SPIIN|nr:unnamed protein product [Spirodela intermedia]
MGSRAERGKRAMEAMRSMGFPSSRTKSVLKRLLNACENNWEHIEAENYWLLVEAILEEDEPEQDMDGKQREAMVSEEPESRRKRLRKGQDDQHASSPSVPSAHISLLKKQKVEIDDGLPMSFPSEKNLLARSNNRERTRPKIGREHMLADTSLQQENIEHVGHYPDLQRKSVAVVATRIDPPIQRPQEWSLVHRSPEKVEKTLCLREPKIEPDLYPMLGGDAQMDNNDPITCEPPCVELPISVVHPLLAAKEQSSSSSKAHCQMPSSITEPAILTAQNVNEDNDLTRIRNKGGTNVEITNVVESTNNIEIASSTIGEKKVSLLYNVAGFPDFHMPSFESVLKRVEDRCLRSYRILDPRFSLMNIMKEVCKSVLELGTDLAADKQEDPIRIIPSLDSLKASGIKIFSGGASSRNFTGFQSINAPFSMVNNELRCSEDYRHKGKAIEDTSHAVKRNGNDTSGSSSELALVCQHEPALGSVRPVHDISDISKGEERVRIPIVNEFSSERWPPHFSYIPHSIVYQNAYLNFSLARIGDEDYCSDCFGDCLSASIPCACARETGGEFAYTPDGLLKKEFLDECISVRHDPPKHRLVYCKDCPLERSKNDVNPDDCKGHLVRKFIKECWSKCGCNKQCGNRVVQQGIACNLQVFWTPKGKGWGLRTTDDLPRGAFICEYVGEVLTNMELYDRTLKTTANSRHTYPVLLDADWGSEGVLKDEEALCLDGTFYGNVARFINHRCFDANLVEVPVEVETPDRHYYHIAFFTARKIEAFEELTWDYGIDFDDHEHPIKAFRCLCGSRGCRDRGRSRGRVKYLRST